MSLVKNKSVRCDWCGKLSRHPRGEYTKPDGVSVGYINAPNWDPSGADDICEECEGSRCPGCGSDAIVSVTPSVPGPRGWGGRCKACGYEWSLPQTEDPDAD